MTLVFYDNEEVEAARNGLGRVERNLADWLAADLALLGSRPTARSRPAARARCASRSAPPAGARTRRGRGSATTPIHRAAAVLERLAAYDARDVDIDGCEYREGLQAVRIDGGVAGNVVPDECVVTVNFRFAPDRTVDTAAQHVREVFDGLDVTVTDSAAGRVARPRRPGGPGVPRRDRHRPRGRSTAGPTWRGSPRSASPP